MLILTKTEELLIDQGNQFLQKHLPSRCSEAGYIIGKTKYNEKLVELCCEMCRVFEDMKDINLIHCLKKMYDQHRLL